MATRIVKCVSGMLELMLCAFVICMPLWAQPGSFPVVHTQCSKVLLTSDDPRVPARRIEPYLRKREDFRASKLVLTNDERSSEVSFACVAAAYEARAFWSSILRPENMPSAAAPGLTTPSMIARDVMNEIRQVCPGSIAAPPLHRRILAKRHGSTPVLNGAANRQGR
jgi:hypothetical protein